MQLGAGRQEAREIGVVWEKKAAAKDWEKKKEVSLEKETKIQLGGGGEIRNGKGENLSNKRES